MQTVTALVQMLKSGEISLSASNQKLLELTVKTHQIDLNIIDNRYLKDLLKENTRRTSFRELLKQLKTLAEELKNQDTTITISYQDLTMLTIGSGVKPTFSQLITGTKEIEINNLQKLLQIALF